MVERNGPLALLSSCLLSSFLVRSPFVFSASNPLFQNTRRNTGCRPLICYILSSLTYIAMSYPVHPTSPRGYVQTEKDETPPLCRQDSTIINLLAPTGPFKRVKSAWRRVKHPASTVMTSFCLFLICIIIGVFFSYQKDKSSLSSTFHCAMLIFRPLIHVYRVRSAIDASAAFTGGVSQKI